MSHILSTIRVLLARRVEVQGETITEALGKVLKGLALCQKLGIPSQMRPGLPRAGGQEFKVGQVVEGHGVGEVS